MPTIPIRQNHQQQQRDFAAAPPPVPPHSVSPCPSTASSSARSQNGSIRKPAPPPPMVSMVGGGTSMDANATNANSTARSTTFVYSTPPVAQSQHNNNNNIAANSHAFPIPAIASSSASIAQSSSDTTATMATPLNRPKPGIRQAQQQQQHYNLEAAETECLEHYEYNLEKYKDERDTIQKKTFTKWVNQHLIKNGKKVADLFVDLRDGNNLISLLEALTNQNMFREHGFTRFHRIQNVQCCLELLRRRNIKLVNIRPEDIVEGNPKLTLGLIWTIILNFQVSAVINHRQHTVAASNVHLRVSATTASECHTQMLQQTTANAGQFGPTASHTVQRTISESVYQQQRQQTPPLGSEATRALTARDALLAWAKRITDGYQPEVNVTNFTGSWKNGTAFLAILHHFRPALVNWEKLCQSASARERLHFAFDGFEREFGVAKLLDAEDVCDVDSPDERSLITYISQLHNRLVDEPKGTLDDLVSRLTRGIGITNEKLDVLLNRIENVDAATKRGERTEVLEREVREIADELHALKAPIDEFFVDVETLRQHRYPEANDFHKQVLGLEQRRTTYLGLLEDEIMARLGIRPRGQYIERHTTTTTSYAHQGNAFRRVEDAIKWVRDNMYKLNTMQFSETLETLEQMFEQHKLDNRDIQDFRQTVDECIARQAEVSAEDSYDYCELLKILESEYQQLRELSAGRMVDLDSLIAFIRAAQLELVWIHEREDLEVTRNWSDVHHLDIPMLQNYFKQLLHEIELHEKQFNDVHNQGAALINQRHPGGEVIEVYLRTMQNQWDWLLNLSKCLEGHLRDAYNAKSFQEEAEQVEQQMQQQLSHLDQSYNRTEFSLDDGERMLRELDSIREHIQQLHGRLLSLTERCAQISPLWQRGERVGRPIAVNALCEYKSKEIHIRQGDECTLLDNHDLLQWRMRGMDGVEATVPSVVFRIPPPDPRLANLLSRLHGLFEKLRKLWDRKHHMVRYNMVLNTMRTVRGWDLDTFLSIPPDQRDEIMKALNEDVRKLLAELDPNDPLARRLKEELELTNQHFYDLLGRAQKGPEPDFANQFDEAAAELIRKFEDAWRQLSERAQIRIPENLDELERQIHEHKIFEDNLQALDVDVSNVKELFRQLPNPTPNQRAKHDLMISRWEEIWELCRMYVERLKALEKVLKSVDEVTDIVRRHEVTLASFDDMPAALERLRGVHAQLVELNMVLQQQRSIVENLNKDTAQIRSHVARTRLGVQNHPDVDLLEELVTNLTVRWDNVNSQVTDRLRIAEEAQQTQMVYRSQYDEEIQWLDRVEATIDSLRRPEELHPEDLQGQLDQLTAEYAQLQEHTATIENINKEGGKFIRDARSYDIKLGQYHDNVISIHGQKIKDEFRRHVPQPKNGAQVVTDELEELNRRFAQLSSVILERKNIVNVLIQNWRRKQQESLHSECLQQSAEMHSLVNELGQLQRSQQEQLQQFALNTADDTKTARKKFVELREKLHLNAQRVEQSVAEADRLCVQGADSLTPEQFHMLKESRQRLHNTFESLLRQTDSVLARLDLATALLLDFTSRASSFQSWVFEQGRQLDSLRANAGDPNQLDENRKAFRILNDEILSKRPEISGISQMAQRIETEINAYVDEISGRPAGREGTPSRGTQLQQHRQVGETAQRAQDDYEALLTSKQELDQLLRRLSNCSMQYDQNLSEAENWLSNLERAISHATVGAADDTETRLANLLRLNQNAVEGQPKIDDTEQAARQLDDATAQTDAHERLQKEHAEQLDHLRRRYRTLSDRLKDGIDATRTEMTQREGLAQGLRQMQTWLAQMEQKTTQPKCIPLNSTKLSGLKYEDQLERAELESKEKTLCELGTLLKGRRPSLNGGVEELMDAASSELGQQFALVNERFRRVESMALANSDNLQDAIRAYEAWQQGNSAFNGKMTALNEAILQLDTTDMDGSERLGNELTQLEANDWAKLQHLAQRLLEIPNVEETGHLMEKMRSNDLTLGRLRNALGTKMNNGQRIADKRREFWQKSQLIGNEISQIEAEIKNSIRICADLDGRKEQQKECQEMGTKLMDIRSELDELEQLGTELIQAGGIKRTSMVIATAQDAKDAMEPLTQITRQLLELRHREEEAERALADLNARIEQHDSASQAWNSEYNSLSKWMSGERAKLSKLWDSLIWESAPMVEIKNQSQQGAQRIRQQQPKLMQLQMKYRQLTGRRSMEPSDNEHEDMDTKTEMDNQMDMLKEHWNKLESNWLQIDKCIGNAEILLRDVQRLEKWLDMKQHVLDTCTVPAADVKLIDAQLNIIKMLQNEQTDETARWHHFNDEASETVRLAESKTFCAQIVERSDDVNKRWRQFEQSLNIRLAALDEARKQVANFDNLQRDVRRDLRSLESALNESAANPAGQPEQKARLAEAEHRLENQLRPSIEQLQSQAESIKRLLEADASLRSDLDDRVDGTKRTIEELTLKLQSVKNAAKSATAAEEEVNRELTELLDWVQKQKWELDTLPAVVAEQNRLIEQIEQFQQPYAAILAKEGQVIVVGSKSSALANQSAELRRHLLTLNEIWPPLLTAAKERQERLERTKKALDELLATESDTKEALNKLNAELESIKAGASDKDNTQTLALMESIYQRLRALGPCVESAFVLMDKLEKVTGGGGVETKKHRLALEQLRRDYKDIMADCVAGLEQIKTNESLRARFDSEVDSLQSLLDTYQSMLKLDEKQQNALDVNGNAPYDGDGVSVGKDALKLGLAEFNSRWQKGSRQLQSTLNRLRPNVDTKEATMLESRCEQLEDGAKGLKQKLMAKLAEFEKDEGELETLVEKGRTLLNEIKDFDEKISTLPSIGRDQNVIEAQKVECKQLDTELKTFVEKLGRLNSEWAEMPPLILQSQAAKSAQLDLQAAEKHLNRQKEHLELRDQRIGQMRIKIDELDNQVSNFHSAIGTLLTSNNQFAINQPLGTDITTLTAQQEALKSLKNGQIMVLAERKEKLESECKELIKGAGTNVATDKLEAHLSGMNTAWQQLSTGLEQRERQLDAAIQALGSIREAQQSLLNWLDQTEELLMDQRLPASDYKVVKAQLQNLNFQLKLVNDKRPNVDGFLELVNKLVNSDDLEGSQADQLQMAGQHIVKRYNILVDAVNERHQQLQEALVLSTEWAKIQQQLSRFLDDTEKGMHVFERIPTDARRMDEQIALQASLQQQVESQRENFDRLIELSDELCQIVAIEDAQEVDSTLRIMVSRYDVLGTRLQQYSQVMSTLAEDIGIFLGSTAQLASWLDQAEHQIQQFNDLPIEPEDLSKKSEELVEFVNDVSVQAQLLENVIEISRELCAHTSGSEALTLQYRTDQLKQRYNQLADDAESKIVLLEKALPLAENLKEGHAELKEHLDGVEEDLQNLGQVLMAEQFQLVNTIESDLGPARDQLEVVQATSVELQRLTMEQRANQLAKESAELLKRFNAVADTVAKKADQLRQAERQSRLTFDVLDFWIDWFNEVQEQIVRAEKPAVDIEQLKQQLRQHRQLNDEITAERNGLREMIADATKVARELSSTLGGQEGQEALLAKVDRAKKLAEETAELAVERMAELEQAFALCKELDTEYTELNDWMDGLERELRACEPITTGMPAKALLAQQQHNNSMLQQIQGQRPMVAKFERNVAALSELCSETDGQNLKQINENVAERFDELTAAFRERGDVLTASLEQSSQIGDRLNVFLSNLGNALDQLRAQEPPSCRPPVLHRQLAEMEAIFALIRQKEPSFMAMKAQGEEIIAQTVLSQQTATEDVQQRLEELERRWLELNSGAKYRHGQLEALLPSAEHFWLQLDQAQQGIDQCRQQIDVFAADQSQPDDAVTMEQRLQQKQIQMQQLESSIMECAGIVQQAIVEGTELCARLNAEEEQTFVQQHLAAMKAQWDAFRVHHAQLSGTLNVAMEQFVHFHLLLQQLLGFLAEKEAKCANALLSGSMDGNSHSPLNVQTIREQLQLIGELRHDLDNDALLREQLNQMGAEICAAQPAGAGPIRISLNELNGRWNRLYAELAEHQHRLERALLDMGQFAHAHAQLLAWIDQTQTTLSTVNTKPTGGLKHVEIELCKLRVLKNDIAAHQSSYDAILTTGQQMIRADPQCTAGTQPMLDALSEKWMTLGEYMEQIWSELERARADATMRGNDLEKWQMWITDVLNELKSTHPLGGLPDTAAAQLDEFRIVKADVEQRRPQLEECLQRMNEQLRRENLGEEEKKADDWQIAQFDKLSADWELVQKKLVEREKRLRQALEDALELVNGMQELQDWLEKAEQHIAMLPATSKLIEPLEHQIEEHRQFNGDVQAKSQLMKDLNNKGVRMQLSCEKKDAIPMKNRLVSLKHRCDKLTQRSNERTRTLNAALDECQLFFNSHKELLDWIQQQQGWLKQRDGEKLGTGERIREMLDEHKRLMEQVQRRTGLYDNTRKRGDLLSEHAPAAEKRVIEEANEELRQQWTELGKKTVKRQHSLEEALIQSGQFEAVLTELLDWLQTKLPKLEAETQSANYFGDLETINALMREHFELVEQADARKTNVKNVQERAEKILKTEQCSDPHELEQLGQNLTTLNDQWVRMSVAIEKQDQRFTTALKKAVDLSEMMHELDSALQDIEANTRRLILPWEEHSVLEQQLQLEKQRAEFTSKRPELERLLGLAVDIQSYAHPKAETPIRDLIRLQNARWELLEQLLSETGDKLRKRLDEIRRHERKLDELIGYVEEKQGQLELMQKCKDEGRLGRLHTLMDEQQMFKADLEQRQTELDDTLKMANKRRSLGGISLKSVREEEEPTDEGQQSQQQMMSKSVTEEMPKRRDSQLASAVRRSSSKMKLNERSPSIEQQQKTAKPKHRRKSEQLLEEWKRLWADLQQYEEYLKERKTYLDEMERLKDFTFDEWRERYVAWNDHGKARVSDLFRRIDKSGTGMVPRKLFIDGILASKFPTSELEMNKVADEFDKGDGLISSREFMNALRYDPKKMRRYEPKTETERIHDEIARETARCTCAHRFPIHHISTDKDRVQYGFGFGGSMKRMVRILRSTVMVRVGGGWEALDAFLGKHDPCRAKGRINVDLIPLTPEGHSGPQGAMIERIGMFTRRRDSSSSAASSTQAIERLLGYSPGQPGPIMKVREKTERSVPMFKQPLPANTQQYQQRGDSNHSIIDDIYGSSRIPRPGATSHVGSDIDSKPSRPASHASDIGSDFGGTRIPSLRAQKGVRFTGVQSSGSGRNTPSGGTGSD